MTGENLIFKNAMIQIGALSIWKEKSAIFLPGRIREINAYPVRIKMVIEQDKCCFIPVIFDCTTDLQMCISHVPGGMIKYWLHA